MTFETSPQSSPSTPPRVLNTGSGPVENKRLHACFTRSGWGEVRLDIDPWVRPDIVGSIENLRGVVDDGSFDAVWSSHSLEHLYPHQVLPALREFRRILRHDGFAMITCPDLEQVARLMAEQGPEGLAYVSPVGPISAADMMFGHRASLAAGNTFMAHHTGFTAESLGALALDAGFAEAHVGKGGVYDLWAVLTMPATSKERIAAMLSGTPEAFLLPAMGFGPPGGPGR